jgi:hypothetical protein
MPYCGYDDRSLTFIEDHTSIADTKPHTIATFEALYIAVPGRRKFIQPLVDSTANVGREFRPLTSTRGREGDRAHPTISHTAILWSSDVAGSQWALPLSATPLAGTEA